MQQFRSNLKIYQYRPEGSMFLINWFLIKNNVVDSKSVQRLDFIIYPFPRWFMSILKHMGGLYGRCVGVCLCLCLCVFVGVCVLGWLSGRLCLCDWMDHGKHEVPMVCLWPRNDSYPSRTVTPRPPLRPQTVTVSICLFSHVSTYFQKISTLR